MSLKAWSYKRDTHKTSTLSNGEEVGYLKGKMYHETLVIDHMQFPIHVMWKYNDWSELDELDEYIADYSHKNKVKVLNACNEYYLFCKREGLS